MNRSTERGMKKSAKVIRMLARYESRNVVCVDPAGGWPIVWESAHGAEVRDVDGRKYVDLSAGFGVCAAGHANRRVVQAACAQMRRLMHAMGDVHPHPLKAELARELSRITFERWTRGGPAREHGKVIFCNSGFESVEAALKTAHLATGRPGVIAFEGAYHGLGYGALNVTHRDLFRKPFLPQLAQFGRFVQFPTTESALARVESELRAVLASGQVGAVLVEPVQGRGGIRVPPAGFLPLLRRVCDEAGALLVLDEVFTGFGRTGRWFACEHSGVVPDLICLGKALTGGFPLSACVGRASVMDRAWPASTGEAIHTSTFLGHPVGCAMALANIAELRRLRLPARVAWLGRRLMKLLQTHVKPAQFQVEIRGLGLMVGVELWRPDGAPATAEAFQVVKAMLRRGFILIPEGAHGNVLAFTPPLVITEAQLSAAARALGKVVKELAL